MSITTAILIVLFFYFMAGLGLAIYAQYRLNHDPDYADLAKSINEDGVMFHVLASVVLVWPLYFFTTKDRLK